MTYTVAMKTPLNAFALVLVTSLLAACSGIPVTQDYAPAADFSTLKTYRWDAALLEKEKDTQGNNPLLNSRIHSAIDRNLATMGYQLSANTQTDFTVSSQTQTRQRLTSDGASSSVSLGVGSFGSFGAIGLGTGSAVRDEDEATLIIDILSGQGNTLLWRGTSTRYVYAHKTPEELTNIINQHVDAILAQFPPQKKPASK